MLRGTSPLLRSAARSATMIRPPVIQRVPAQLASFQALAQTPRTPLPRLLPSPIRKAGFASKPPLQPTGIDRKREKEIAHQKLEPDPERVSTESTIRPLIEPAAETAEQAKEDNEDVMRGVKSDLNTVAETVSLSSVPRQVLALGLAGTLPYLATSLSTMYLSWDLNKDLPTASTLVNSLMVSHETASHWLRMLEPIQLGYGAVLISFLGAIHWGLEFAEKTPSRERATFRYGLGVLAPAVAWPTLLLPVEWALIVQFAALTGLYMADGHATTRGWAPHWYSNYRFVLTFVVGLAIFISLVGRAKISEDKSMSTATTHLSNRTTKNEEPYENWRKLEQQEKEKRAAQKKKEEEEKRRKEEEQKKKEEQEKKEDAEKEKEGAQKEKEKAQKEKEGAQKEKDEAKSDSEGEKKD